MRVVESSGAWVFTQKKKKFGVAVVVITRNEKPKELSEGRREVLHGDVSCDVRKLRLCCF